MWCRKPGPRRQPRTDAAALRYRRSRILLCSGNCPDSNLACQQAENPVGESRPADAKATASNYGETSAFCAGERVGQACGGCARDGEACADETRVVAWVGGTGVVRRQEFPALLSQWLAASYL